MLGPDRPRFASPAPSPAATAAGGAEGLSPAQWAAVRRFVAQVGGVENARSALDLLAILSAANESHREGAG
jgi:hypothetical protein